MLYFVFRQDNGHGFCGVSLTNDLYLYFEKSIRKLSPLSSLNFCKSNLGLINSSCVSINKVSHESASACKTSLVDVGCNFLKQYRIAFNLWVSVLIGTTLKKPLPQSWDSKSLSSCVLITALTTK